jgi:hypothetical protein
VVAVPTVTGQAPVASATDTAFSLVAIEASYGTTQPTARRAAAATRLPASKPPTIPRPPARLPPEGATAPTWSQLASLGKPDVGGR